MLRPTWHENHVKIAAIFVKAVCFPSCLRSDGMPLSLVSDYGTSRSADILLFFFKHVSYLPCALEILCLFSLNLRNFASFKISVLQRASLWPTKMYRSLHMGAFDEGNLAYLHK